MRLEFISKVFSGRFVVIFKLISFLLSRIVGLVGIDEGGEEGEIEVEREEEAIVFNCVIEGKGGKKDWEEDDEEEEWEESEEIEVEESQWDIVTEEWDRGGGEVSDCRQDASFISSLWKWYSIAFNDFLYSFWKSAF